MVTGAMYDAYWVGDLITDAFDGTAQDTSASSISVPTVNNRSIGVMIQIDAENGALEYKQSNTFNASISLQKAFINSLLPTPDTGRFLVGYVKLTKGASEITAGDIWNTPQFFTSGSASSGGLGYENPIASAITLTTGRQLLMKAPVTINAGASLTVEASSTVFILPDDIDQSKSANKSTQSVSANYSITTSDNVVKVDASSGAITVTLPSAVGINGQQFNIKAMDISGGNVTVATTSSQTIDGGTTATLTTQYENITVHSDGANWVIL
jgi:hypothetical protein